MTEGKRDDERPGIIPKDFWQMVQTARTRAQAEVARKRETVYQAFITEEVKAGKRVPMPREFWHAVDGRPEFTEPPTAGAETAPAAQSLQSAQSEGGEALSLPRNLSFKDAALVILQREGRPMTAKEIVAVALNEGMLSSAGKTPDASLAGQIYTDIHRNRDSSPFVIVGPRTYALKAGAAEQVAQRSIVNFPGAPAAPLAALSAAEVAGRNIKMSYKQAALHLLERESRPMTAKEIVTIALKEGLIESSGKTPDATLAGQLYTEIQRTGERSPIKLIGPRTYALSQWYKR